MADEDTKQAEAPVTESPPADATAPQAPSVEQLQGQITQLQAEKAKLENDIRSTRGLRKQDLNIQARIDMLEQRVIAFDDSITALVTELSGDPDASQRVEAIKSRQQASTEAARKTTEGQAYDIYRRIAGEVAVAHGINLKREPQTIRHLIETSPEWAEVREMVIDAWGSQNLQGLEDAHDKAEEVRQGLQEKVSAERAKKAAADARKEAEAEAQQKLVAAGVYSTAAGGQASAKGNVITMTRGEFAKLDFRKVQEMQQQGRKLVVTK